MTWVIGMPSMFGYCVGLADVQATITYSDGTKKYFDSVQKIYPVGKFIVAGFSGTIKTGFRLIDDLKKWSHLPERGVAWIPDCLVIKWRRRARRIFSLLPDKTRGTVSILLIGVYPQRDNGIPGEPQTYMCVMDSPDFEPRKYGSGKIASIGSGNNVAIYADKIGKLNEGGYNPLMQMEVGNIGGYGQALMSYLSTVVNDTPVNGISNHMHYCIVRRGGIAIRKNDFSIYPAVGSKIDIRMPTVATNWDEFVELMNKENVDLSVAQAIA